MGSSQFRVDYTGLSSEFINYEQRLIDRFRDICSRGQYILRSEVQEFEQRCCQYIDVKHAIGVASGSDALLLALKALDIQPGDEIITVSHTFVATVAAIHHCGAKPVLVDIGSDHTMDTDLLEQAITKKTKAIIPVHMNGHPCNMNQIQALCRHYELSLIEDAAQAFGACYYKTPVGGIGDMGCFSFHPMKSFHALGDAGLITTNDDELAEKLRLLRNHGQITKEEIGLFGFNSRLDNLQAGFLIELWSDLESNLQMRRKIAQYYQQALEGIDDIHLPVKLNPDHYQTFSSYVIEVDDREALHQFLLNASIETFSHWPRPLHKQTHLPLDQFRLPHTERISRRVLSLPIHPLLDERQIQYVIDSIKAFYA